jgi:hypothetical protein
VFGGENYLVNFAPLGMREPPFAERNKLCFVLDLYYDAAVCERSQKLRFIDRSYSTIRLKSGDQCFAPQSCARAKFWFIIARAASGAIRAGIAVFGTGAPSGGRRDYGS